MTHLRYAAALLIVACGSSGDPGTVDRSTNDSGSVVDGSKVGDGSAPLSGTPFTTAANETWTWVDVPGTACANGAQTGVGVNFTSKSTDVLVFLEGGGACWDGATCYGGQSVSTYLSGYGATEFATDPQRVLFATSRVAGNPFKDMNMIYVPYCTGDVHAGDNVVNHAYLGVDHITHHVGGKNLATVLARVAATFPKAARVWIAGDSAGGFGAALSVQLAKKNFPNAKLGILDDSGQPVSPAPGRWDQWRTAWNLQSPSDCPACATDPTAFVHYYQSAHPDVTFALLSFNPDPVISGFMGIDLVTFSTELGGTLAQVGQGGRTRYYIAPGSSHVVLTTQTVGLSAWLQQMVDGSPTWQNEHP